MVVFDFELTYDQAAVVQVEEAVLGDLLGNTGRGTALLGLVIDNAVGTVQVGGVSFGEQAGPSGEGVLITFTLRPQAQGSTNPSLSDVQVKNTANEDLIAGTQDGQVTVGSCLFGDLDCDCDVDIMDVMMIASWWNSRVGDELYDPRYDFDADGDIDIGDVMTVATRWGSTC